MPSDTGHGNLPKFRLNSEESFVASGVKEFDLFFASSLAFFISSSIIARIFKSSFFALFFFSSISFLKKIKLF